MTRQIRKEPGFGAASRRSIILETPNASDIAGRLIRGMIFSGELAPGERLPPVRELARQLGIAVLTLRVGLKSLESAGFIVTTRGAHGGSRVCDVETLSRHWADWMRDKGDEVDDLWEFREIIETNIAALAAERRTESELAAIEAALKSAADDSHTAVLRWNVVFHDEVARAAHSTHLHDAMIAARMELFLPVGLLLRSQPADELRRAHADLFEAIRAKDAERARESMRRHVTQTRRGIAEALRDLDRAQAQRR